MTPPTFWALFIKRAQKVGGVSKSLMQGSDNDPEVKALAENS